MRVLIAMRPNWRDLSNHENSPVLRGMSLRLKREDPGYVVTQESEEFPLEEKHRIAGRRSENLEAQTFEDEIFDIVIT